jgi:hypothetical protein
VGASDDMPKKREQIPRCVRDAVLKEFNHRCAVCGADTPHLHHIDEEPSNNDVQNLIPLCPNCHLVDQHDASNAIPRGKLRLFRRYKHRNILKPQFNPIFRRLAFLSSMNDSDDADVLKEDAKELVELVLNLAMGQFYGMSLKTLLDPPKGGIVTVLGDPASEAQRTAYFREKARKYREQLCRVAPEVEALIIEMLDYQTWG